MLQALSVRISVEKLHTSSLSFIVPSLRIDFSEPVAMNIAGSPRYDINGPNAAEEWRHLLPEGGHTVRIDGETYTVTLFHQLKCLDLIREEHDAGPVPVTSPIVRHCMNYLRQTLLCHPNLSLELGISPLASVETRYDIACRDWTKVYSAVDDLAEEN